MCKHLCKQESTPSATEELAGESDESETSTSTHATTILQAVVPEDPQAVEMIKEDIDGQVAGGNIYIPSAVSLPVDVEDDDSTGSLRAVGSGSKLPKCDSEIKYNMIQLFRDPGSECYHDGMCVYGGFKSVKVSCHGSEVPGRQGPPAHCGYHGSVARCCKLGKAGSPDGKKNLCIDLADKDFCQIREQCRSGHCADGKCTSITVGGTCPKSQAQYSSGYKTSSGTAVRCGQHTPDQYKWCPKTGSWDIKTTDGRTIKVYHLCTGVLPINGACYVDQQCAGSGNVKCVERDAKTMIGECRLPAADAQQVCRKAMQTLLERVREWGKAKENHANAQKNVAKMCTYKKCSWWNISCYIGNAHCANARTVALHMLTVFSQILGAQGTALVAAQQGLKATC